MHRVLVDALGKTIEIDVNGLIPGNREAVANIWADARPEGLPACDAVVEVGGAEDFDTVLADLSTRVTIAALDARRGSAWLLHAGGIADEAGRVVGLVGRSGAGKTTAVSTLARTFAYVTDETLAVRADGRIAPYRKPLSIVRTAGRPKAQLAPSAAKLLPLPRLPLVLVGLLILDRRTTASATRAMQPVLTPLSVGEALVALVEQSSYLAEMARPLETIVDHLVAVGGAHRLTYDDAQSLPEIVARCFVDGRPVPPRAALRVPDHPERAAFLDAIQIDDGQLAVLTRTEAGPLALRVLSQAASEIWRSPSDRAGHDLRMVEELVRHGLLTRHEVLSLPTA